MNAAQRWQAEVGYALDGVRGRELWAPYVATEAGDSTEALRLGVRQNSGPHREMQFEFGRSSNGPKLSENAVELQGLIRW